MEEALRRARSVRGDKILKRNETAFDLIGAVEFKAAVYVVHFFQKKSKKGIATPQSEINLIKQRLVWLREQVKAEAKRK